MNNHVLVISRKPQLIEQLREQFGEEFTFVDEDSPAAISETNHRENLQAVIAHLGQETLNGTSPSAYLAKLSEHAGNVPVYVIADETCPPPIRQLASDTLEACITLPVESARLDALLRQQPNPAADMAGIFTGKPHKAIHGHTRSLITFTPSMFDMIDELKVAAAHNVTVLLIGETGSGKSFLAKLIHEISPVQEEQVYTVACGALPPDLIESELFGYVKGAFTGANSDREGKFAAAGRGTLLLDEIDVLPPEQQAKLLRVIETGEYEPVGCNETRTSQARLVVASNLDLETLVERGTFRRDLYYRLNILAFHLKPLRERPADIEFLARNFAFEHARKHNVQIRDIDDRFLRVLCGYHWPGNIRELENVVRRAVLYCQRGVLTIDNLPSSLRNTISDVTTIHAPPQSRASTNKLLPPDIDPTVATLEKQVGFVEQQIIEESLRRNLNHRQDTAAELGISRVTLYNKMKKFGLLT